MTDTDFQGRHTLVIRLEDCQLIIFSVDLPASQELKHTFMSKWGPCRSECQKPEVEDIKDLFLLFLCLQYIIELDVPQNIFPSTWQLKIYSTHFGENISNHHYTFHWLSKLFTLEFWGGSYQMKKVLNVHHQVC